MKTLKEEVMELLMKRIGGSTQRRNFKNPEGRR